MFSPLAIERSRRRMILPERVLGRLSPKRMSFGLAIGPISLPTQSRSCLAILSASAPAGRACFNTTKAQIASELREWVGKEIGPIAKPKDIRFGDNLPKTRSGKIMRRLLRSIAKGEEITQDVSTLENPAILEQLKHAQ
jgi:acetyl-CoA synthetase